jgi:hypothetical protein
MRVVLTQLRALFAVIVLIAAGGFAGTGLAEQALVMSPEVGAFGDSVNQFVGDPAQVTSQIATPVSGIDHDGCDGCHCRPDSVNAAGFGCCAAGISATGEYGVTDRARAADRFAASGAFLLMGIDPEALLQPPQIFA